MRHALGRDAQFRGVPVERRLLEVVGVDGPVELVGEEVDDILERRDGAQLVRIDLGHDALLSSIQHTSEGRGAPIGASSCLRYVFLMCFTMKSRTLTSIGC